MANLYRLTCRHTGRESILMYVKSTSDDGGKPVHWFSLPDDPGRCLMPMTLDEVEEFDWEQLKFIGKWLDASGMMKCWFCGAETQAEV